ncbi:two-component system histidine kinase PnpS [Desulfotomaculum nigrificans]|uniref:two-component system histidine kinase PnpS n=1 Tax=Desulfotomaculum nigrificans TaxID=1565 RepID=UPI0001FAE064|nr:ATP-binding protein [Desulfotomaculum nigrificans]
MLKGIRQRTIASYMLLFFIFSVFTLLLFMGIIHIFTALLAGFWATVFTAWIIDKRVIAPVEQITSVAQEMAGGILDNEITIEADEALDDLAWSINYMARELRKNLFCITEERNRAQAILNSMADGVIALDKYRRVILLNPAVKDVFGLKENEGLGMDLIKVIRNYELDDLFSQALHNQKTIVSNELQILTPEPRFFRVHVSPLKGINGEIIGVVGLLRDITERRKLERMRTEFVANVSHELRTPLTSINGFLETLLDGAIEDPKTARHFLEIMNAETKRLANLIDDLLQLSRLEDRKTVLNKQPVDLRDVINGTIQMFKARAEEKGIKLFTVLPDKLPQVPGDHGLLTQVMVNLIDNAIKYTPAFGQVKVGVNLNREKVRVYVADTGIGIPQEDLPRIFERFYRVDKARSRVMGGTGLGLAICKHIVEVHGGQIEVESGPGGSTFSFTLPLTS